MIYLSVMYIIAKFNLLDFGMALIGALIVDVVIMYSICALSKDNSRRQ